MRSRRPTPPHPGYAVLALGLSAFAWQYFLDIFNSYIEHEKNQRAEIYIARYIWTGTGEAVSSLLIWFIAGGLFKAHGDISPSNAGKMLVWGIYNGFSWRIYADFGEKIIAKFFQVDDEGWAYLFGTLTLGLGMLANVSIPKTNYLRQRCDLTAILPNDLDLMMSEIFFYLEQPMPLGFAKSPAGNRDAIAGGTLALLGATLSLSMKYLYQCTFAPVGERRPLLEPGNTPIGERRSDTRLNPTSNPSSSLV